MLYGNIPGIGEHVSRIFYGTSMFSSGKDADELLDAVTDMGINALDTARVYGHSEEVIGRWMKKRGNRHEVILLTKCCHPLPDGTRRVSEQGIRQDLETSLKMLGTDDIDILVLHRDDPSVDVAEIVETCSALIREGKIRAYGGSNWTHERIAQANAYAISWADAIFCLQSQFFPGQTGGGSLGRQLRQHFRERRGRSKGLVQRNTAAGDFLFQPGPWFSIGTCARGRRDQRCAGS